MTDTQHDIYNSELQAMPIWCSIAEDKLAQWQAGKAEGFSTGFPTLDKYFRLVDGEMVTIAGRPSMGKTILGMQIMELIARGLKNTGDPGCVAIYSAEMTGWSLVHRMAGALAGVEVHKLRMGQGMPKDFAKLSAAVQGLRTLPIQIDDGSAPTTQRMLDQMMILNENIPVRAMLFDFLELGGDRASSEEQRISSIAVALKDIAKAIGIPVIALSQINRSVENRANKMPTLADLRYSGQIEQISDVVCFIMRPEYYVERGMAVDLANAQDGKGIAYISIAKNRHGPPANVRMHFNAKLGIFGELERVHLNEEGVA